MNKEDDSDDLDNEPCRYYIVEKNEDGTETQREISKEEFEKIPLPFELPDNPDELNAYLDACIDTGMESLEKSLREHGWKGNEQEKTK